MSTPQNSPRIFLTHSWHDLEFARRLYGDLQARGFALWFDDKTMQAGHRLAEEINKGLEWCDVYMPVISRKSLASQWCWEEINAAIALSNQAGRNNRPEIIPVVVEDCQLPALLAARLCVNFTGRYEAGLEELLQKGLIRPPTWGTAPVRAALRRPAGPSPARPRTLLWAMGAVIAALALGVCVIVGATAVRSLVKPPPTLVLRATAVSMPTLVPAASPTTAVLLPTPLPAATDTPQPTPPPPTYPATWTPIPTPVPTPAPTATPHQDRPTIFFFQADRDTINAGESAVLSWDLANAQWAHLRYDGTEEGVVAPGNKTVSPSSTKVYTLIAHNAAGDTQAQVTITVKLPPPVTHSTGALDIPQTWQADLDEGTIGSSGADIWFNAETATQRYVAPVNGARIVKVGTGGISRDSCAAAAVSTARININNLPSGTYVCVRTNQGRVSGFRVNATVGPSPGTLKIGYTTWE